MRGPASFNMKKNKGVILDLCGGTGSWSQWYRKAGYTVHVITLPNWSVQSVTFYDESLVFMPTNHECNEAVISIRYKDVVGILAAPPCTMFSRARTTARTPRDFDGAMEVVEACLKIIWNCRKYGKLRFWAMENPMGMLRQFMGDPPYHFRGWEYGDAHVKFTDLWGYFKMPKGRYKKQPAFNKKGWSNPRKPAKYKGLKLDRAGIRSITPPKFAKAFTKINV